MGLSPLLNPNVIMLANSCSHFMKVQFLCFCFGNLENIQHFRKFQAFFQPNKVPELLHETARKANQ